MSTVFLRYITFFLTRVFAARYIHRMRTHPDIIALWPNTSALAHDVGLETPTVRSWKRTGRIPPHRYDLVLAAAARRGFDLSYAELTEAGRK